MDRVRRLNGTYQRGSHLYERSLRDGTAYAYNLDPAVGGRIHPSADPTPTVEAQPDVRDSRVVHAAPAIGTAVMTTAAVYELPILSQPDLEAAA